MRTTDGCGESEYLGAEETEQNRNDSEKEPLALENDKGLSGNSVWTKSAVHGVWRFLKNRG